MIKRIFLLAMVILLAASCQNTANNKEARADKEGDGNKAEVKKYYSEGKLVKEVTFKNGVRNGICRNYYDDGRLRSTIWYENGLKEDTAKWYYREGMLFRATPYKNDKLHGIQTKYYKTGRVQATLPYRDGLRLQGLKEYLPYGGEPEKYPAIEHTIREMTDTPSGEVKVFTKLSNESTNVRFYRGSLIDGAFDPDKCQDITTSSGMGFVDLKPNAEKGKGYVDIIGVYITRFGNKKIITTSIKLPYNNLY